MPERRRRRKLCRMGCCYSTGKVFGSQMTLKMAAGEVESDFSALCFDDKTRIRDVSECKYCIK